MKIDRIFIQSYNRMEALAAPQSWCSLLSEVQSCRGTRTAIELFPCPKSFVAKGFFFGALQRNLMQCRLNSYYCIVGNDNVQEQRNKANDPEGRWIPRVERPFRMIRQIESANNRLVSLVIAQSGYSK